MSDLIDRQSAIDALERTKEKDPKGDIASFYNTITDNKIAVIEALPSTQPEIIRCKDCKHQVKEWREDKRFKDDGYWVYGCEVISDVCGYWALFGHNDQFCSEAERRNDG